MFENNINAPLISVLMTSYNREKYIAQAIESVLFSTYKNLELIIVDDCSKDSTVRIALGYAEKDSRVKVYVNEKNLGDYPNRNRAATYANGYYLKYVDADDYIYPWGLELLEQMMKKYPEAGWGLCSLEQNIHQPFPIVLNPQEAYEYNYLGPGLFHKAPLSSIIKKDIFEKIGGFPVKRMTSDNEMWHKLAMSYPVVLMPHGIVWYREHGEQEMKYFNKYRVIYEEIMITYLKNLQCPLDLTVRQKILNDKKRNLLFQLFKAMIKLNIPKVMNCWKCLHLYYA